MIDSNIAFFAFYKNVRNVRLEFV